MWNTRLWIGCVVAALVGACSGDDGGSSSDNGGQQAGTAPGATTPGTPTGATGTMPAGGTTTTGTGDTAGAAGAGAAPMLCGEAPDTTACGPCPEVAANLAMICVQACCTAEGQCGTLNNNVALPGTCALPIENDSMCPNEVILGTDVPGCCVEGTNTCGVVDLIGIAGGGCVDRAQASVLSPLAPLNCDGTPVMMTGGTAGAGAAGSGAAGSGAAGSGAAGSGAAGSGAAGSGAAGSGAAGAGG